MDYLTLFMTPEEYSTAVRELESSPDWMHVPRWFHKTDSTIYQRNVGNYEVVILEACAPNTISFSGPYADEFMVMLLEMKEKGKRLTGNTRDLFMEWLVDSDFLNKSGVRERMSASCEAQPTAEDIELHAEAMEVYNNKLSLVEDNG